MISKLSDIVKRNIILSGGMCLFTLLIFLALEKQGDLAIKISLMGLLLLLINIFFSILVHKYIKGKFIKILLILVLVISNIVISFSAAIYMIADNTLFYPNQDEESYNINRKNGNYEEIEITSEEDSLAGWMFKNVEGKAPLVIYFGGNGECSANRFRANQDLEYWNIFEGYNFMMIDYPGYGNSEGRPSDSTMYEMALKTYDYVLTRDDVDVNHIVIMGYSIGTGVSTYLASQRDIEALILWAPYNSGLGLYNSQMNIFYGPLTSLVKNKFESERFAASVRVTPLILATKDDEAIPYRLSVLLSEKFANGSNLITYEGFKHNDFWSETQVLGKVKEYLQEVKDE